MTERLIAAPATAAGRAGLSVVRLTGPSAIEVADRIFCFGPLPGSKASNHPSNSRMPGAMQPAAAISQPASRKLQDLSGYRAAFGYLYDAKREHVIDQAVALVFRAPHSYTGEDTVEFSIHGGPLPLRLLLERLYELGASPAEPGEFTRKAFLNGKLDLSQAEAVMDLIHAEAERSSELAVEQLSGRLSERFHRYEEELYALIAGIEVGIEYPEHEDFVFIEETLPLKLKKILAELDALLAAYHQGRILRQGMHVLLIGAPNVGKSSLLNALSHSERAIVTDIPGTTRDTLDISIDIRGIPVKLIDTAGLRETDDPVERIGVERARAAIKEADLIFRVLSADEIPKDDKNLRALCAQLAEEQQGYPPDVPVFLLLNKNDLDTSAQKIEGLLQYIRANREENLPDDRHILSVSALNSDGLDAIEEKIVEVYRQYGAGQNEAIRLSSERHFALTQKAREILLQLSSDLPNLPQDLVSQTLMAAAECLAEMSGHSVSEKVLDEIFSRFCVGK